MNDSLVERSITTDVVPSFDFKTTMPSLRDLVCVLLGTDVKTFYGEPSAEQHTSPHDRAISYLNRKKRLKLSIK